MDTGSKSLAQLSEEGKEKKYVSVEIASKVSGYTRDYLERLCRLQKVEYLLRSDGAFGIELESLLNETHTILLSYEGVNFLDRSTLSEPSLSTSKPGFQSNALHRVDTVIADAPPTVSIETSGAPEPEPFTQQNFSQAIPRFGDVNHLTQQSLGGSPFSFVGRSVVSDGKATSAVEEKEIHIPIGGDDLHPQIGATVPEPSLVLPQRVASEGDGGEVHRVLHTPIPFTVNSETHVKIEGEHTSKNNIVVEVPPGELPPRPAVSTPHVPVKLTVSRVSTTEKDHWDDLFVLPEQTPPSSPTPASLMPPASAPSTLPPRSEAKGDIPSVYRPIQTSVDATEHHEEAPLFPVISKFGVEPLSAQPAVVVPVKPETFTPPSGQRVTVFDPGIHTAGLPSETKSAMSPIIPRAVPQQVSSLPDTPLTATVSHGERTPSHISPSPTGASLPSPAVPRSMTPRPAVPLMRVMPQTELALPQEQHLIIPQAHSLLAYRGLNAVFGLFIGTGALLLLGGVVFDRLNIDVNSTSYVASVGAAMPLPATNRQKERDQATVLPFSNSVVVATGTPDGVLKVAPVLRDGATGETYEYTVLIPSETR